METLNEIDKLGAELLKDCGVESRLHFEPTTNPHIEVWRARGGINDFPKEFPPAYSWTEIEDNAEEFFGEHERKDIQRTFYCEKCRKDYMNILNVPAPEYHLIEILKLRLQKKYEEADKHFRDNCILIK